MKNKNIFASLGLLINSDEKVLSVSRRNKPNDLGLPGGKLEPNETPIEALIREVKEETGLILKQEDCVPIFHSYEGREHPVLVFHVKKWQGIPCSQESEISVTWANQSQLTDSSCSFHQFNTTLFLHLFLNPLNDEDENVISDYEKSEDRPESWS